MYFYFVLCGSGIYNAQAGGENNIMKTLALQNDYKKYTTTLNYSIVDLTFPVQNVILFILSMMGGMQYRYKLFHMHFRFARTNPCQCFPDPLLKKGLREAVIE